MKKTFVHQLNTIDSGIGVGLLMGQLAVGLQRSYLILPKNT